MGRGYPNPSMSGMRFDFSVGLGMGRATDKYIEIGYGDGEGKTHPHPRPIVMPRHAYFVDFYYQLMRCLILFRCDLCLIEVIKIKN